MLNFIKLLKALAIALGIIAFFLIFSTLTATVGIVLGFVSVVVVLTLLIIGREG